MKKLTLRLSLIASFFWIFACKHSEEVPPSLNNSVLQLKKTFQKDSLNFAPKILKSAALEFSQSLVKIIDWNKLEMKGDVAYFPLYYKLPEGTTTASGGKFLENKSWLVIKSGSNSDSPSYNIFTLYSENGKTDRAGFTGFALLEEFFTGKLVKLSQYVDGVFIAKAPSKNGSRAGSRKLSSTSYEVNGCKIAWPFDTSNIVDPTVEPIDLSQVEPSTLYCFTDEISVIIRIGFVEAGNSGHPKAKYKRVCAPCETEVVDPFPEFPPGTGGGSSGGGGMPSGYTPSSADIELIAQVQRENHEADSIASNNPNCYGTGRSGNVKFPGTAEHWLIQFDYVNTVMGGVREYSIPGAGPSGGRGYADIANTLTNEMFEIKPDGFAIPTANAEVENYIEKAKINCPPSFGVWQKGTGYSTAGKYFPHPTKPGKVLKAWLVSPGVIYYKFLAPEESPQALPVMLPQNLADKLKNFVRSLNNNTTNLEVQIVYFLRQNPEIIPYLKAAAVGVVIGTIVEDIASGGVGVLDDPASFLIARTIWRLASAM
jgi:hypothetical protein